MLEVHAYRVKVYSALPLFQLRRSPSDILGAALRSLPSAESRSGYTWHIGNLTELDEHGVYFRIGRTSRGTIQVYAEGSFEDQEFETAPYTHVVMDTALEVCGVAKKTRLTPTVMAVASQLARVLNRSGVARDDQAEFEIAPISDPDNLIQYLVRAVRVMRFWITFSRPNPFDADADFVRPMQRLLRESAAKKGKTQIEGKDLVAANLEKLARSAAATGDDAAARLQVEPRTKPVKKRLRDNPLVVQAPDMTDLQQQKRALRALRKAYTHVHQGRGRH
jgi:hypothetical protein